MDDADDSEVPRPFEHMLTEAEARGDAYLDVTAGDLHRDIGGYPPKPGTHHQMPMCCDAMRTAGNWRFEELSVPPSRKGASLTIRYWFREEGANLSSVPPSLEGFMEGEALLREVATFARNPRLVAAAKAKYGHRCAACSFDFGERYGALGEGYIECHHINPVSGRDGIDVPTAIEDVVVLCANCHAMVHRKKPALTLAELVVMLREAAAHHGLSA